MLHRVCLAGFCFAIALAGALQNVHAACTHSTLPGGTARYMLQGDEVHDGQTRLVWQRCSLGTAWRDGACTGERTAFTFDEAHEAAGVTGSGWRLPTVQELASLVDLSCGHPVLDRTAFPDVSDSSDESAEEYWSSSPSGLGEMRYFVEFYEGYVDIRSPGFHRFVRLVRPATGKDPSPAR